MRKKCYLFNCKIKIFKGFNVKYLYLLLINFLINEWIIFVDWDILEWYFYLLFFVIKNIFKSI